MLHTSVILDLQLPDIIKEHHDISNNEKTMDLLALPLRAIDTVCAMLDDQTLLGMREV